jgi:hypothetical protein
MNTIEIGAGLEFDGPPRTTEGFSPFDELEANPFDETADSNAPRAARSIEPVVLASAIDFVAEEPGTGASDATQVEPLQAGAPDTQGRHEQSLTALPALFDAPAFDAPAFDAPSTESSPAAPSSQDSALPEQHPNQHEPSTEASLAAPAQDSEPALGSFSSDAFAVMASDTKSTDAATTSEQHNASEGSPASDRQDRREDERAPTGEDAGDAVEDFQESDSQLAPDEPRMVEHQHAAADVPDEPQLIEEHDAFDLAEQSRVVEDGPSTEHLSNDALSDAPTELPSVPAFESNEAAAPPRALADVPEEDPFAFATTDHDDAQPEASEPQAAFVSEPQAFVTETMAELYLQQGHLDSALDIYHRLVAQRPGDDQLYDRMRAIEDRVHGRSSEPMAPEPASKPVPLYGGPTIRDFLRGLAEIRPAPRDEQTVAELENGNGVEYESHDEIPVHDDSPRSAYELGGEPNHNGSSDLIDEQHNEPAAVEASAPTTPEVPVAAEMVDEPAADPLHGLPAHRATSELSLDHVFKGAAPVRSENEGFSFGRFFSPDASAADPKLPADGRVAPAAPDDIAQFNTWLNGLKKT